MWSYIAKRILSIIPIMLGVSFITFSLTLVSPSDPVSMKYESMGETGNQEAIEVEKEALGLNDHFLVQYAHWLGGITKGDFGTSVSYNAPVATKMAERLPNTLLLGACSIVLTILLAIPLGILSAVYHNRIVDYVIRFLSFIGVSMPSFWLGLVLIYWFAVKLDLLPIMGMGTWQHLILPTLTLAVWLVATYIRRLRTAMLEEMNSDYVVGLLSRGVSKNQVVMRHILPNSLLSIITMFGMSIGVLLGGTIIVETIFNWQGIGKLAVDAISSRDYVLIKGYVLWMSFIYVLVNLLADIFNKVLDPRIRLGAEQA